MNNDELVRAWKSGHGAGIDHPAGEITLNAVPSIAQRAALLAGWCPDGGVWADTWTLSGTITN
jgi:hypothetical protein